MRAVLVAAAGLAVTACGPSASGDGCKDKLLPGDVVITEVFADAKAPPGGSGTDEGKEWFEIYNATDRPIELKGMTVTHSKPDGVTSAKSHVMDDVTIAPGQFFTLGNTTPDLVPPYIDYGYSADLGDFFNTDGGKLALKCKSTEIDSATYEGIKEGHSRELSNAQPPDYTINDDPNQWCQANDAEFETGNFGTPGSDSDCQPVVIGQCSEGGVMRDSVPPMPGDLVITELMPKPRTISATTGQWFEVLATNDVDLNGVGLDRANDSSAATIINSATCIRLRAGSYGVFARSADISVNGGITTLATFPFSLNPAMNADVQLVYGGNVIDAVTWTMSSTGASLSLDPDFLTATGNDSPSNFCNGVGNYEATGPNAGTPGMANPQCATVAPAGMCDMGGGVLRAIVKPASGALVITEFLADPAGTDTNKEWFEVTNTSQTAFDLNELKVSNGAATAVPAPIQSSTCISVAPGAFALLAQSIDAMANAGLPPPDATFGFTLTNSGVTSTGIRVYDGTTLLDGVSWSASSSGKSIALDPDHFNTTDNDTAAVTAGVYCLGTTTYGDLTNTGTPRAANPQCP
jgi:hypothetical protein